MLPSIHAEICALYIGDVTTSCHILQVRFGELRHPNGHWRERGYVRRAIFMPCACHVHAST